ncbi:MAG TPA: hypothetical protein PLY00_02820 [Verrucomicrobiota bacterium]|nr:hypothetical protein [Verrucomicrobiota bacterium]HOU86795.1 hypothetical protein [Verrucomicrobiota bacterium]
MQDRQHARLPTVHLGFVDWNGVCAAWGLPAAPACAVPHTADRPLRFAAQAGYAATSTPGVSTTCRPGALTGRQNTDNNQMHQTADWRIDEERLTKKGWLPGMRPYPPDSNNEPSNWNLWQNPKNNTVATAKT